MVGWLQRFVMEGKHRRQFEAFEWMAEENRGKSSARIACKQAWYNPPPHSSLQPKFEVGR